MQRYGRDIAIIKSSQRNRKQKQTPETKYKEQRNRKVYSRQLKNKEEIYMYAIQKLALKMAPHVVANPGLIVPAVVIGGIALICDALD